MTTTKLIIIILTASTIILSWSKTNASVDSKDTILQVINTNIEGKGAELEISFYAGAKYSYPEIAIWIEDMNENYIQTLYVSQTIAKGIFPHGQMGAGKWLPGEIRRPAALPYWAFKRNIKELDGLYIPTAKTPIPDAYTGATPLNNFKLQTKLDKPLESKKIRLLLEINQSFDWNEYWSNTKFINDSEYKTSCQPSIIYYVTIDLNDKSATYYLNPIGHGHYSGKDGKLYTDLSTLTTAQKIVSKIIVVLK